MTGPARDRRGALAFWTLLLAALLATRALHIAGPIDDPHSWRQCDTAQYARDFYEHGIDLLRPSVCWMGGYKTLILEFPLPEALMALAYHAFGVHLWVARIVTLLFFAGATAYLYGIVAELGHRRLATITAATYVMLPLSLYYSRAVHIDFFAVFFAHAMTFHLLRAFRRPGWRDIVPAAVAGILAFLVKAPYAFYFALPLLVVAVGERGWRSVGVLAACLGVASIFFLAWRSHVSAVNAAAPDWSMIPGYSKFVNRGDWYFGPLAMRLDPRNWAMLRTRFVHEVASPFGSVLFLAGMAVTIVAAFRGRLRGVLPLWAWLAGTLGYVLIFFNLNYIHDYYQIPLLAVAAVFIALAIDLPVRLLGERAPRGAALLSFVLFLALSAGSIRFAQRAYFHPDGIREEAALRIAESTPPDALVVAVGESSDTDCNDPRLLYRAHRLGWSVNLRDLSQGLVESLKRLGATHVAVLVRARAEPDRLFGYPAVAYPLSQDSWKVVIADIRGES